MTMEKLLLLLITLSLQVQDIRGQATQRNNGLPLFRLSILENWAVSIQTEQAEIKARLNVLDRSSTEITSRMDGLQTVSTKIAEITSGLDRFERVSTKIEEIASRLDRFERVSTKIEEITSRLDRFDKVSTKIEEITSRLDRFEIVSTKIEEITSRLDRFERVSTKIEEITTRLDELEKVSTEMAEFKIRLDESQKVCNIVVQRPAYDEKLVKKFISEVMSKTLDTIQDGLANEKQQRIRLEYSARETKDLVNNQTQLFQKKTGLLENRTEENKGLIKNQNELFQKKTELLEKRVEICLTSCNDIDECVLNTDNCDVNAGCVNTPGSYNCTCFPCFNGDGLKCTDVDECVLNTDNCDVNAGCVNTPGSYNCTCFPGFNGDGLTCTDVDECVLNTDNCDVNAGCVNTPGSYNCTCFAGFNGDGLKCTVIANDCWDLKAVNNVSQDGVYDVLTSDGRIRSLRCDMTTDGGGWTVFQRRGDGSVRFDKTYEEYKLFFGNLTGEFWMGNDFLNVFTRDVKQTLRVDICNWDNKARWAKYKHFSVGPSANNYRLAVDDYSGTAGETLIRGYQGTSGQSHNGVAFSAPGGDHDNSGGVDCASEYHSGWWFNACWSANLNGVYQPDGSSGSTGKGIQWLTWIYAHSFKGSEMKIRPSTSTSSTNKPFKCPVI